MQIEEKYASDKDFTIELTGSLDERTSHILRDAAAAVPESIENLTLDFRHVNMLTSSGLREILICAKRFTGGKSLRVINANSIVMNIFEMTRFNDMISISGLEEEQQEEQQQTEQVYISFKDFLRQHINYHSGKVFLKSDHDAYTWDDIEKASQIIAGDLEAMGVRSGTHVGICGANSINWILTFYAVQKLEAAAMLMNPAQTPEETGKVCTIGDITHLCYGESTAMKDEASFLSRVKAVSGSKVERCYSFRNGIDFKKRFNEYGALQGKFEQPVHPDSPAVVIFTSGSTGNPKDVILSAYNLFNAAAVQTDVQRMTESDKTLIIVPLYHIFGLICCFLPCAIMDAVLFVPYDIRTATIIRVMKSERCTILHFVPTMIIAEINSADFSPEAFSSIRCTILAGAGASPSQLETFREKLPNDHFIIAYGLSEMAPVSVTEYDDSFKHIAGTVGRKIKNINIKILNRETQAECAAGESGEILVQGFNLMAGYYNVPLDQQDIDEQGWIHTGDMGYIDEEGYLVLSGRYKDIIIRGGENIMPAEVEAAVSKLPEVRDVKVFGIPSDFYGEEAAACIVLKDGASFNESAARNKLLDLLAKYKIPSHFLVFEDFPVLGSGKIDRAALKAEAVKRLSLSRYNL